MTRKKSSMIIVRKKERDYRAGFFNKRALHQEEMTGKGCVKIDTPFSICFTSFIYNIKNATL